MAKHKSLKSRITEDIRAGKLRGNSLVESIRKAASLGVDASELKRLCEVSLNKNLAKGKHRYTVYGFVENLEKHGVLETKPLDSVDSSRGANLAKQNPGAIAAMQELKNAKPLTKEQKRKRAKWLRDMLAKPKEPAPAPVPQTAKPEVDPDKPRNEYLDHLCPLPSAPAYLDEFSEERFKRLLKDGHRVFQYILPDGRIVDENMHDCQKTKTDDLIPKIKVCKQPEWRMVLRITDGELKWFQRPPVSTTHPPLQN